jgi:hypothetical protein
MQKEFKFSCDDDNYGSKKCKGGYGGTSDRVYRGSIGWESGVLQSFFVVGVFGRNLASVAMRSFHI